jgi:hypothetical protein
MRKNKKGHYKAIQKPFANILYSAIMDAVDVADRHLTDVGINIRTRKWYVNVFCMIFSAAVVEMYSCYCEEFGEIMEGEYFSRDDAIQILLHELMRTKKGTKGSLATMFPRNDGVSNRTRTRGGTGGLPPRTPTPGVPTTHELHTVKKGWCDVCVDKGKHKSSKRKKGKAGEATQYCITCDKRLCQKCQKSHLPHKIAVQSAQKAKRM